MKEHFLVSQDQQSLQKQLDDLRNEAHRLFQHSGQGSHSLFPKRTSCVAVDNDMCIVAVNKEIIL